MPDELLDSRDASSSSSGLARLPQGLLLQVLRLLPQQDRLCSCAATCRSLLTATKQATQEVQLCPPSQSLDDAVSQQQADALVAWLTKHSSSSLQKVRLHTNAYSSQSQVTLCLPWQQLSHLTSLSLHGVVIEAAGCSSSSSSWRGLGQLPLLQQLHLETLCTPKDISFDLAAYTAALGCALQQLVQLTELSLSTGTLLLGGAVLAGASNLSCLQSLKLRGVGSEECPVQFQHLPSSLTVLHLTAANVVASSAPDGSSSSRSDSTWQLPALKQLTIDYCAAPASVLLRLPQLQDFSCTCGDEPGWLRDVHAALPHLLQLQTLQLSWYGQNVAAEDFASVTASSHLTSLVLVSCDVPAGAARHMFGAGRLLPLLQQLNTTDVEVLRSYGPPWAGPHALERLDDWSLLVEAGDAQRIGNSCPALQSLGTLRLEAGLPHAQLLPLLRLSALTELSVGGAGCTDAVAELVLARMKGLKSLCIWGASSLTAMGVLHLTALTALTLLRAEGCNTGFGAESADDGDFLHLSSKWAKSEGAVWQQLECECATNPAVLAVLYERQEAQLRQAQQQLQEQERLRAVDLQALNAARAQLHDTHQRHAQQLQQLQQQHMAELQQHDEQFAAALARIAALETQLAAGQQHEQCSDMA